MSALAIAAFAAALSCTPQAPAACTDVQLLDLTTVAGIDRYFPDIAPHAVSAEIQRRLALSDLLRALLSSKDRQQRATLVEIAAKRPEPEVAEAFRAMLTRSRDKAGLAIAEYLARRGDRNALRILNLNYFRYPVSSWEWSEVVEVFGHQKYYPAVPNLVESLDAMSLNLVGAASDVLRVLYPGGPATFGSPDEARAYYLKRSAAEPRWASRTRH